MAKVYTSTIKISCMKEHTCCSCGNVYAYQFARTIKGTSRKSGDAAVLAARSLADKSVQGDVDLRPCPACGTIQPDMIGQRRKAASLAVFWLLIVVPVSVLIGLRLGDVINSNTTTWWLTASAAVAAILSLATHLRNPNSDLEGNRQKAAALVTSGAMRTGAGKRTGPSMLLTGVPGQSVFARIALLLLLVSVPAAAAPELIRARRGWPANTRCYPPVVGPGDATRIYMPDSITSIKGYCRGSATASLHVTGGDGSVIPVPDVSTNQDAWSGTLTVKDDEKKTDHRPQVDLRIPPDPALAGKTVDCLLHLKLEYPAVAPGGNAYQTVRATMDDTVTLHLAPAGAGQQYDAVWWTSFCITAGTLLIGGITLIAAANAMRKPSTVTKVYPTG
jgi:hypothetical protein